MTPGDRDENFSGGRKTTMEQASTGWNAIDLGFPIISPEWNELYDASKNMEHHRVNSIGARILYARFPPHTGSLARYLLAHPIVLSPQGTLLGSPRHRAEEICRWRAGVSLLPEGVHSAFVFLS
jgi:hypothetical protein